MPHNISILGSTGSIGTQTLQVVRANPGAFKVVCISGGSNTELLRKQANEFRPELVVAGDEAAARELSGDLPQGPEIAWGRSGLEQAVLHSSVRSVVSAIAGYEGLFPLLAALKAGKSVALANKEPLAAAGPLVKRAAAASGAEIIPVDSEHSSIFQCLARRGMSETPRRIILTASGGPFLHLPLSDFAKVTPEDAVKHPNWSMGKKISVDSATLMNKGLEVIEAAVLFDLPARQIEVVIHPESIVHGLVEYSEGTMLAAMFTADMRIPISYAMKRLLGSSNAGFSAVDCSSGANFLDLAARGSLNFIKPDIERFPALRLCYQALEQGGTAPCILSAANEIAVGAFLKGKVTFSAIPQLVEGVLNHCPAGGIEGIEDVITADALAREQASKICEKFSR